MDVWGRIRQTGQYPMLVRFTKFAQILSTFSSDVEQAFFIIKLFRTSQRSRLSEQSLEGLVLVHQAFQGKENIEISRRTVELYQEMKKNLSQRKSEKKEESKRTLPIIRTHSQKEEEIKQNIP